VADFVEVAEKGQIHSAATADCNVRLVHQAHIQDASGALVGAADVDAHKVRGDVRTLCVPDPEKTEGSVRSSSVSVQEVVTLQKFPRRLHPAGRMMQDHRGLFCSGPVEPPSPP
jgi:hypothetical protein